MTDAATRSPLAGRRVLVTRAREQAGDLVQVLRQRGAEPVEFPVITIEPPDDLARLDLALAALDRYDWVVFTSANGVRFVCDRLAALGRAPAEIGRRRIAAIGPATAATLVHFGLRADLVPDRYIAEAIADGLGDVAGRSFLLLRADIAREALAERLRAGGGAVDEVTAYSTRLAAPLDAGVPAALAAGQIDVVMLTSSSTVRNLVELLGRLQAEQPHAPWAGMPAAELVGRAFVGCIGPITAETAHELGVRVDVVAAEHTIPGLLQAIESSMGR
ncbi:MAG: uroporphyrinogen-III synthase [Chloroflexi bacterium]|nr:uroporphyrinogen-III synthase [Chloroflexota bacterium]